MTRFTNTGLDFHDPLVEKLRAILVGGEQEGTEYSHKHSLKELGITTDDLRRIGKGAYNLYMKITVLDQHHKPLVLDATEFISWQGTVPAAQAEADPSVTADVWAKTHRVVPKSRPIEHSNGDTQLFIETPEGTRRAVGGGILTEPFGTSYGYQRIIDRDTRSPSYGKELLVGGDGELDIYVPKMCWKKWTKANIMSGRLPSFLPTRANVQTPKHSITPVRARH